MDIKETKEATGINEKHKDRLFKFIFGNPDHKAWTLSLYNAVNGSSYSNPDDIKITTIEDVVYMHMKNDVSFLVDNTMNFYEGQSTYNPNMPMRFLIYAGMVYSKHIEEDSNFHMFSSAQQKAPTPKCICFYNGLPNKDDEIILSLKDSFDPDSDPDIEVKVRMININYGHNKKLMEACKPIHDYALFIDRIRFYKKQKDTIEEAVDAALTDLPDDSVIKPFLIAHRSEVKRMCITEYDEERTLAETKEDGKIEVLVELVNRGLLSLVDAAATANMSVAEFEVKAAAYA